MRTHEPVTFHSTEVTGERIELASRRRAWLQGQHAGLSGFRPIASQPFGYQDT
jgi:hypothetical protein